MIRASIEIDDYHALSLRSDELKEYVEHKLSHLIAEEVRNKMSISKAVNISTNSTTYVASLIMPATTGTVSITPYTPTTCVQNNLRVIEYTKNGKVSRVELQQYDEQSDSWFRIPRIQMEEQ